VCKVFNELPGRLKLLPTVGAARHDHSFRSGFVAESAKGVLLDFELKCCEKCPPRHVFPPRRKRGVQYRSKSASGEWTEMEKAQLNVTLDEAAKSGPRS
jgi:hypothetical protein